MMIEPKFGVPASSIRRQVPNVRQALSNSESAIDVTSARDYLLKGVEQFSTFLTQFVDSLWGDRLYSTGYWAVRDMSDATPRPRPLVSAEANSLLRWLDEIDAELQRIERDDEWEETNIPRIILDASAIVREGEFDTFDWPGWAGTQRARLVIPILVVRELDDLKNFRKSDKARPRLKKLMLYLGATARGPAVLSATTSIELLMDPPRHVRLWNDDAEITRRAQYLAGRRGGPVRLVTGDYTMVFTARAAGIQADLTPAEIVYGDGAGSRDS
jgi:hypothetical protein